MIALDKAISIFSEFGEDYQCFFDSWIKRVRNQITIESDDPFQIIDEVLTPLFLKFKEKVEDFMLERCEEFDENEEEDEFDFQGLIQNFIETLEVKDVN